MLGGSKNNRENYQRKWLSANRPSNNCALVKSVYEIAPKSLFWAPS